MPDCLCTALQSGLLLFGTFGHAFVRHRPPILLSATSERVTERTEKQKPR